ncbi:MAG TPA: DinB family protein [Terriglobales bacterium]
MAKPQNNDQSLREQVVYLLEGGGAHAKFDDAIRNIPPDLRGKKVNGLPHTLWMLLEHMRIAQHDILEFSRSEKHVSPPWPEGYWPKKDTPASASAWDESVKEFRASLKEMADLVRNPKTDLFAKIPWGDGQTVLREALLVADHNAYHVAQMVDMIRLLGAWPKENHS